MDINKKCLIKNGTNNEANNKFDQKANLKWLGLKQAGINYWAKANKSLNPIANKARKLDVDKINNQTNPILIY